MPPQGRAAVRRTVTNENDENGGSTRLTRAKAAALTVEDIPSKPLQTKKAALNVNPQRKRAALGDVSNVTKGDAAEVKKGLAGKPGLGSKAAQPTGVQKNLSRTNSARSVLGTKDSNKATAKTDLKRSASGSGVLGGIHKKRQTTSSTTTLSIQEELPVEDGELVHKKIVVETETRVTSENTKADRTAAPLAQSKPVKQDPEDEVLDLDAEDIDDPLMVAEYVHEIFDYLRELEVATKPNPDYMKHQHDLEWNMRGILVDWLVEVHNRFHLLPETMYLAVNIIDRFLSQKTVQLDRLQLVGVTAMFIASKYEEVLSPHVGSFRHVADDGFTEEEILAAERWMLQTLNYDLSYPNPMNFLRRISKADYYDIHTRTLGKYLLEIGLADHRCMKYLPSHVSAAAMYFARAILDKGDWNATLVHYAGYDEKEIQPVFKLMVDYVARPVVHEAMFRKYASKKFLKASILTRQWAKKHAEALDVDITTPLYETSR